jgi:hypothetical protein
MRISRDRPAPNPREETGEPQKAFLVLGATPNFEVRQGSITEVPDLDGLVDGVDAVVSLLGDAQRWVCGHRW